MTHPIRAVRRNMFVIVDASRRESWTWEKETFKHTQTHRYRQTHTHTHTHTLTDTQKQTHTLTHTHRHTHRHTDTHTLTHIQTHTHRRTHTHTHTHTAQRNSRASLHKHTQKCFETLRSQSWLKLTHLEQRCFQKDPCSVHKRWF